MPWQLSTAAERDLLTIAIFGIERFGADQAKRYHTALETAFDLLASNPGMGPKLASHPNLRKWPTQSHLIIYSSTASSIRIERILHKAMDVDRHL